MTGRSLMSILQSRDSGQINPARNFVLTGMEKHVYLNPSRAIRTKDFLYIRNFDPAEWSTGEIEAHNPKYDFKSQPWPTEPGAFSFNIDPSPTKQLLRLQRNADSIMPFANLAFLQHPDEELYDLRVDPHQLRNVAGNSKYVKSKHRLRQQLDTELIQSDDPRLIAPTRS